MSVVHTARIAIVGGGLSGLYAARVLARRGLTDVVVLEARDRVGGRVQSVATEEGSRFDLGATWIWPEVQPELAALIDELGLAWHAQHEQGDRLLEHAPGHPPQRAAGFFGAPQGMRLRGGMADLTDALARDLPPDALHLSCAVQRLHHTAEHIDITAHDAAGQTRSYRVEQVLLALPPRLAAHRLRFDPPLPTELTNAWARCATWMAPHAKFVAIYDTPFWRARGLSGAAHSAVGPLVEVHDASSPTQGALFGFIGVPAHARRSAGEARLKALCHAQLVRLFGEEAAHPQAVFLEDWAQAPHTAVADDQHADGQHPHNPPAAPTSGVWQGRLVGAASEWSPAFSGYLAGAVDAARRAVAGLRMASAPGHGTLHAPAPSSSSASAPRS